MENDIQKKADSPRGGNNLLSSWAQRNLKWVVLLVMAAALVVWLLSVRTTTTVGIGKDRAIDVTPEQIQSIRQIGQWEFLAVADEELVDTTRKGFFSDDHLARIYYGTLRLGIDLGRAADDVLAVNGDTVVATLPAVGLLDDDFIDEARTRAFYESGRWTASDREALYRKACSQMLAHCLTEQNLRSAEQTARREITRLLQAMGYDNVVISFTAD